MEMNRTITTTGYGSDGAKAVLSLRDLQLTLRKAVVVVVAVAVEAMMANL